ncbi:MAG TPA: serine hydrolase domain-containing protein [Pyrinomonadaceae bacterium]|nr:serine hydrolase domain-containing protein [Pyrinomonadaceae bacterium]
MRLQNHYVEQKQDEYDRVDIDPQNLPHLQDVDNIVNKRMFSLGHYLKDPAARRRIPGAAVLVRKDNRVVHLGCYGYANLETGEQITPYTLFDLGSVSKQFTAYAVMGLLIINAITEKTVLSEIFEGLPLYADRITIGDLIHHTAGLPQYWDILIGARDLKEQWYEEALRTSDHWYPFMSRRARRENSNSDVMNWLASQKLLAQDPDVEFDYSNTGYVILAEVVKAVAGVRFADYVQEGIFDPIEMKDSYVFDEQSKFRKTATQVRNHAKCYNRVKGYGYVPVGYTPLNFICGDGNVHSNILDLAKWDAHLHRLDYRSMCSTNKARRLEAEHVRDLLWDPIRLKNRKRADYGAGWFLARQKYEANVTEGGQLVKKKFETHGEYHNGEWLGFRSFILRAARWEIPKGDREIDPETWDSLGIIVLTNNHQFKPGPIAQEISQLFWGKNKRDNIINTFDY